MPSVFFNGDPDFADLCEPVPSKSEWGMDVLTRIMTGAQSLLVSFMESLAQGQTYTFNGHTFYLQSWSCDNDLVFPKVTLIYKGLIAGIPDPKVSGKQVNQSLTVTCSSPSKASRSLSYFTREATYLYIKSGRPTGPTNTALDVSIDPIIWFSVIRNEDGTTYSGSAPVGLVTALTPAAYDQALLEDCIPVIGSPYFECTDTVIRLYTPMDS